jgi:hypothetical protein
MIPMMPGPERFLQQNGTKEALKARNERIKRDFAASRLPGAWKVTILYGIFFLIIVGTLLVFWRLY